MNPKVYQRLSPNLFTSMIIRHKLLDDTILQEPRDIFFFPELITLTLKYKPDSKERPPIVRSPKSVFCKIYEDMYSQSQICDCNLYDWRDVESALKLFIFLY